MRKNKANKGIITPQTQKKYKLEMKTILPPRFLLVNHSDFSKISH